MTVRPNNSGHRDPAPLRDREGHNEFHTSMAGPAHVDAPKGRQTCRPVRILPRCRRARLPPATAPRLWTPLCRAWPVVSEASHVTN
jgi:hypothetical protein